MARCKYWSHRNGASVQTRRQRGRKRPGILRFTVYGRTISLYAGVLVRRGDILSITIGSPAGICCTFVKVFLLAVERLDAARPGPTVDTLYCLADGVRLYRLKLRVRVVVGRSWHFRDRGTALPTTDGLLTSIDDGSRSIAVISPPALAFR